MSTKPMGTVPYGEYAERAARSLAVLVRGPALPQDPGLWPVALTSRDIVIGALRDRLWNQFVVQVTNSDLGAHRPSRFDVLQSNPVVELAYVVERFPRMAPAERMRPTDALADVTDPVAQVWVNTAKELLVANHTLNTAETRPWRTEMTAHAALASDTAQIVEAISVLDQRLQAAGALDTHDVPDGGQPPKATTARLVASSVDRLAQWVGEHGATDLVFTPPNRPLEFTRPVHLVQVPADLAAAQRVLASFLRPMADRNLPLPDRLSAATALIVAHNQVNLIASLHQRITASPGLDGEVFRTERLQDMFDDTLYATRGLHDALGPRVHTFARGQQQEISIGVRKGQIGELSDDQTRDLLVATEAALGTWATALRREIGRPTTELRIARRGYIEEPIYGRIAHNGPAVRALTALAKYKPANFADSPTPSTGARTQLRDTLTQTPPFEIAGTWPSPGRRHADRRPPSQQPGQQPGQHHYGPNR